MHPNSERYLRSEFTAAVDQVEDILDRRRFAFAICIAIVPAVVVSIVSAMIGTNYVDIEWVPEFVKYGGLVMLIVGGCAVQSMVLRAHYSLSRLGLLMKSILDDKPASGRISLKAVSTSFFLTVVLWVVGGVFALVHLLDRAMSWAVISSAVVVAAMSLGFRIAKRRSDSETETRFHDLKRETEKHGDAVWPVRDVRMVIGEEEVVRHAKISLRETYQDMVIVITMASALFFGCFNALSNAGNIQSGLEGAEQVRWIIVEVLPGMLLVSIILSINMMFRLRRAVIDLRWKRRLHAWDRRPETKPKVGFWDMSIALSLLLGLLLVASGVMLFESGRDPSMIAGVLAMIPAIPVIFYFVNDEIARKQAVINVGEDGIRRGVTPLGKKDKRKDWWTMGL